MNKDENPKVHHNFKQVNAFLYLVGLVALGTLVFVLVTAIGGEARTITVDDGGGANYTKISTAVMVAHDGDTIRVYEGSYTGEDISVSRSVNLIGNGSANTTIYLGYSSIMIRADRVNISGFEIRGSRLPVTRDLTLENSKYCTLTDIHMVNGIYIFGKSIQYWNTHNIDNTNIVNGKPVYYYKNASGMTLPSGAGQVILANCTQMRVENQNISNGGYGILIGYSSNNTISNNTCSSNNKAIYLYQSNHNTISNNKCSKNNYGIGLWKSNNNILTNNTCNSNINDGTHIMDSHSNIISNNNYESNDHHGICLYDSSNNILKNNWMVEDAIFIFGESLEYWNTHCINISNSVNGKPVYYYKNITGITVPSDAGQVILANCTHINVENQNLNTGTLGIIVGYSSNITISNNTCLFSTRYGICIWHSDHNILRNNTILRNDVGIKFVSSHYNTIINNNCHYNHINLWNSNHNTFIRNTCTNYGGMSVSDSSDNSFISNICSDNGIGFRFSGRYENNNNTLTNNTCNSNVDTGIAIGGYNNILKNNTCSNNRYGISLGGYDNVLTNNTCNSNANEGITLYGCNNILTNNTCSNNRYGIYLEGDNNILTINTCNANNKDGISLGGCNNNTFANNTCNSNNKNGIFLRGCNNNTLASNTFNSNNKNGISLGGCNNNTLVNNTCNSNNKNGIHLLHFNNSILTNHVQKTCLEFPLKIPTTIHSRKITVPVTLTASIYPYQTIISFQITLLQRTK